MTTCVKRCGLWSPLFLAAVLAACADSAVEPSRNTSRETAPQFSNITQSSAPWGLDRIDQRIPILDGMYNYTATGAGVTIYFIDIPIRTTHNEFTGRATNGPDFVYAPGAAPCTGNSTASIGAAAGTQYGVAKQANIVGIRVRGCDNSFLPADVIEGINWVTANAVKPAVAIVRWNGPANADINAAITSSINSGITYIVPAGDNNADACTLSPASTPGAITVAGTGAAAADPAADVRYGSSNFGSCVDIFAPAYAIYAASGESDGANTAWIGTLMAAGLTAGVAALYLEQHPTASPAEVSAAVLGTATLNVLSNIGAGSPNRLLYAPLTAPSTAFILQPAPLYLTFVRDASGATISESAEIRNLFKPSLNWSASAPGFLTLSANSGTLAQASSALISVNADQTGLAVGSSREDYVTFTDTDDGSKDSLRVVTEVFQGTRLHPQRYVNLTGTLGTREYYVMTLKPDVPVLQFIMNGDGTFPDRYVRYGRPPNFHTFECPVRGFCQIENPPAGTYYVMLSGRAPYTVNFSAYWSEPMDPPSGVAATAPTSRAVNLTWTNHSPYTTGFRVDHRLKTSGVFGDWAYVGTAPGNATSFVHDPSVLPILVDRTYQYRVQACAAHGCSAWVESNEVTTNRIGAPLAPSDVTADQINSTQVEVIWRDNSDNETEFKVARRSRVPGGIFGAYALVARNASNHRDYLDTNLTHGLEYQYRITACNADGCSTPVASTRATFGAPPPTPTNFVAAQIAATSIRLNWVASNATDFSIARRHKSPTDAGFSPYAVIAVATKNLYTDTTVSPGYTYVYRVIARNAVGNAPGVFSNSVLVVSAPAAPTAISASAVSAAQVNVQWTDGSNNESRFEIWRRTRNPDGNYAKTGEVGANATAFSDHTVAPSTRYQYRVRACNAAGCSTFVTLPTGSLVVTPGS